MKELTLNTLSKEKRIAIILILLICIILIGSIFALICFYRGAFSDNDAIIADIYQNGELLESIPLHSVIATYTIRVTGTGGCTNIIEVRNGSIGIISADCPDKLCVKQGFIDSSLLPITCLPNRVVIQLRTDGENSNENEDINVY